FGNADAVPQPPERCLSRQAGIVRCCLKDFPPPFYKNLPRAFSNALYHSVPDQGRTSGSGSRGSSTKLQFLYWSA
ncbi:MAG: hypothetical protein WA073_01100, partial [Gemmiger qucibialis]